MVPSLQMLHNLIFVLYKENKDRCVNKGKKKKYAMIKI